MPLLRCQPRNQSLISTLRRATHAQRLLYGTEKCRYSPLGTAKDTASNDIVHLFIHVRRTIAQAKATTTRNITPGSVDTVYLEHDGARVQRISCEHTRARVSRVQLWWKVLFFRFSFPSSSSLVASMQVCCVRVYVSMFVALVRANTYKIHPRLLIRCYESRLSVLTWLVGPDYSRKLEPEVGRYTLYVPDG